MTEISIRNNLEQVFSLPPDAVAFLCDVYAVIQVFDDIADGDPVERQDLNGTIWATLVGIPQNPFFARHQIQLTGLMATQILKWQASDTVERKGAHDARSFVWRSGFYDLVLFVVSLCHNHQITAETAAQALGLYGEDFEAYMKEFNNA